MENKKTQCECPVAGYCARHGVTKSAHLHKLCQNHSGYFDLWEKCLGPKQNPNDCIKTSKIENNEPKINEQLSSETKLPSTMSMAKNFITSAAKHVQSGMANVSEEKQAERLKICSECEYIVDNSRCGKCGCFLQTKTKWFTSSCPIGKW